MLLVTIYLEAFVSACLQGKLQDGSNATAPIEDAVAESAVAAVIKVSAVLAVPARGPAVRLSVQQIESETLRFIKCIII